MTEFFKLLERLVVAMEKIADNMNAAPAAEKPATKKTAAKKAEEPKKEESKAEEPKKPETGIKSVPELREMAMELMKKKDDQQSIINKINELGATSISNMTDDQRAAFQSWVVEQLGAQ